MTVKAHSKPMPKAAVGRGGAPIARNRDGSPVTFRMRVTFQKSGRAAMLSHLEIARAMERVVRRAGLPYAITSGFSPHMRIAFGSALPVGVGGLCEILDVLLTERVDCAQALGAMQASTSPALMVTACEYIGAKDPAASNAFPFSSYQVVFNTELPCSAQDLPIPETITVIRKKKEKVLCVRDYLQPDWVVKGEELYFVLKSGENGNLRPDVLVRAIIADMEGVKVQSITRMRQFC